MSNQIPWIVENELYLSERHLNHICPTTATWEWCYDLLANENRDSLTCPMCKANYSSYLPFIILYIKLNHNI